MRVYINISSVFIFSLIFCSGSSTKMLSCHPILHTYNNEISITFCKTLHLCLFSVKEESLNFSED